jgi:hypothetical protein
MVRSNGLRRGPRNFDFRISVDVQIWKIILVSLTVRELNFKHRSSTCLWYDTDRIEDDASNNSSIAALVFIAAVTFLRSRGLAKMGDTRIDTDWWEGFIMYAIEIGSGAMICIPSFIKIGSGIQKLIMGDTQTHRQHGDRISLLSVFQNKEIRLTWRSGKNWSPLCLSGKFLLALASTVTFAFCPQNTHDPYLCLTTDRSNRLLSFHYILSIWYDKDRIENTTSNSSYIVACVFVATETCLPRLEYQWPRFLVPLFRLSGVSGDTQTARWSHKPSFIF